MQGAGDVAPLAVETGVVHRQGAAVGEACGRIPFSFGVTPDGLLVGGVPALTREGGPLGEAAAWLHQRDILQLTFVPDVPPTALEKFLALLSEDPRIVQERGGPGKEWAHNGHPSILVEQIDFSKVLEDRDTEKTAENKDDLWKAIVHAVVERRKTLDDSIQKRMLELMDGARPLVERHNMTDLEVVIQEILQDKIAIDYEGSGLAEPE